MPNPVHVIGAARTDFKRNLRKENKTLRDVIVEAGRGAIADAGIEPGAIQSGVVGNFAAGLFTRQLHLGSFITEIDPALRGIPTVHTEGACASGSLAVVTAAQQIMGGLCDVVLVVGAEQQKTMSPAEGSEVLAAAGDYQNERPAYGEHMFPKLFGRIASVYRDRHGLTDRQLALVAVKNHAHARLNPLAQMRDSKLTLDAAMTATDDNPCFAPPLKISDCSQITDGAAAVVVCSESFAKKLGRPSMRLLGLGHATDHLALDKKDAPEFSIARRAADRAYGMAGCRPGDLSGVEVHDCFSITEILAYEILGLAVTGGGSRHVETGATMHPKVRQSLGLPALQAGVRLCPVNSGGGLMGDGHPVGATGVRQVVSAFRQLTGAAGEHQVDGAEKFFTFNMGGSLTTSVAMIWGRA